MGERGGQALVTSGRWPRDRWVYLAIVTVAAAFWIMPVWISHGLLLDDAELVSIVQSWQLNYDSSQPPLYAWLWLSTTPLFGVSLASTQFVRVVLLALFFCLVYRLGRRVTRHRIAPFLLLASYPYIPLIAWEGTYYQTHTLLVDVMTISLLLVVEGIHRRAALWKFLLLGAVVGLGLIAKYTFVAIIGSVAIGALAVGPYRAALLRPAIIASMIMAIIVVAPPVVALLSMVGEVHLPRLVQEVVNESRPFAVRSRIGAVRMVRQYLEQSAILLAVAAIVWGPAFRRANFAGIRANPDFRFFAVQALAGLALGTLAVIAMGIDGVTNHHPIPFVISLPIVFVIALDSSTILDGARSKWRARAFGGMAAALVVAIWFILLWSLLNVFPDQFRRYAPLAAEIARAGGPEATVISDNNQVAAQLRLHQPAFTLYSANLANRILFPPREPRSGRCVALWQAGTDAASPPAPFVRYVEAVTQRSWNEPGARSVLIEGHVMPDRPEAWRIESLPVGGFCGSSSGQPPTG